MKWIGQQIYDLVARFRNDVYLEDISSGTIASGGNLGLDSNNKIVKAAEVGSSVDLTSEVTGALPVANGGTGATSLTDGGILLGSGTAAVTAAAVLGDGEILIGDGTTDPAVLDIGSSTAITILGTVATGIWNGTAICASYVATLNQDTTGEAGTVATIAGLAPNTATTQATQAAITTCSNLVTVGTIGTGVWEGTAIATDQQKHLATFGIRGYGTSDGTNYEIPVVMSDNQAPFEHNVSAGADGLTAVSVANLIRATGAVMPYAGTLKKWKGWSTHSTTSGTCNVALFRYRPDPTSSSAVSLVLLDAVAHTPAGNNTVIDIEQTSFTDADVAEGDIIISGIKGSATQVTYFVSTLEVEWD